MPAAIFSSVDLPEPFRPTRHRRARFDGQVRARQEGCAAKRQVNILKGQKRWCHGGFYTSLPGRL